MLLQRFLEDLVLTQHLNPQNNQEGKSLESDFYNINKWNMEIFGFNERFIRDFKVTHTDFWASKCYVEMDFIGSKPTHT